MIATDGVRSLIREGKTAQILSLMQTGKGHGMTTLETELVRLAQGGRITPNDAVAKANRPDDVRKMLGGGGAVRAETGARSDGFPRQGAPTSGRFRSRR